MTIYKNKLSISTNYFEIIKFLKKNNKLYKSYFSEVVAGDHEAREFVKKLFNLKEIKLFKLDLSNPKKISIFAKQKLVPIKKIDSFISLTGYIKSIDFDHIKKNKNRCDLIVGENP